MTNADLIRTDEIPPTAHGGPEAPPTAAVTLFGTDDPAAVLQRARAVAQSLMEPVEAQHLYSIVSKPGKPVKKHLQVEAWTLMGAMVGVFPVTRWTRPVKLPNGDEGWEARCEAVTLNGQIVGSAESMCMRSEERWKSAEHYAVRSMASTRATSKCLSNPLRFIAVLGGFSGTTAEEMDGATGFADDEPEAVRLFDALKGDHDQQRWAIVKRFGWTKAKGGAVSKWLRSLADDRQAAIVIAFKQLTMDDTGPPLGASSEPRDEGAEDRDRAAQRYDVHQSAVQRRAEAPLDGTRDELMRVINAMPMNRRASFLSEHGYKGQALKTWLAALDDMKAGELLAAARVPEVVPT